MPSKPEQISRLAGATITTTLLGLLLFPAGGVGDTWLSFIAIAVSCLVVALGFSLPRLPQRLYLQSGVLAGLVFALQASLRAESGHETLQVVSSFWTFLFTFYSALVGLGLGSAGLSWLLSPPRGIPVLARWPVESSGRWALPASGAMAGFALISFLGDSSTALLMLLSFPPIAWFVKVAYSGSED